MGGQKYLVELDSKLKGYRHDSWGWVIYRCAYNSDNDWATFMEKLRTETHSMLNKYGANEAMCNGVVCRWVDRVKPRVDKGRGRCGWHNEDCSL
jgi:hypothetical protein